MKASCCLSGVAKTTYLNALGDCQNCTFEKDEQKRAGEEHIEDTDSNSLGNDI